MSYTRAQLIEKALIDLGAAGVGQAASTDDTDTVDAVIDALIDDLSFRNVFYVADAGELGPTGGEIENHAFRHLVRLLVEECAPAFGRQQRDPNANMSAERALRTLARIGTGRGGNLQIDSALRWQRRGSAFDFSSGT